MNQSIDREERKHDYQLNLATCINSISSIEFVSSRIAIAVTTSQ